MNLDKHDLFRNATPGFVFLVVVLSFYIGSGHLQDISNGQEAFLGLIAGFPVGIIIQSLYRVWHVYFPWGEQNSLNRLESSLLDNLFTVSNKSVYFKEFKNFIIKRKRSC